MSPPEVWGPAVWTLLHTLSEKVSEEAYPFIKFQLFSQIRRICGFLPCPECSTDATNFLAKININDLKTKVEFRNTFYLFHNWVNVKKRKPLFNYSKLVAYNNYGIIPVINNFISKYNTNGNMKLISESFQRKLIVSDFKSWFTKTIRAFTPPQNIPSLISVTKEEPTNATENNVIVTEDIVITVEEPIVSENVVNEDVTIVEEDVITENVTIIEDISENVAIVEEDVITEDVVNIIEDISEEVVTEEDVVAIVEDDIVKEQIVTVEVVTEEAVVQSKTKKGKKTKKR
jgi:hypothetical protein